MKFLLPHQENIVAIWKIFILCCNDSGTHHLFGHLRVVLVIPCFHFVLLYIMNIAKDLASLIL